ncbi:hypothetical protein BV22DRAFT_979663, partial [Leucogyrophana mollusca]
GPLTNGKIWHVTSSTPGLLAWCAVIVIFLLSPDKGFSKERHGPESGMVYPDMFYHYKKLFVMKWNTQRLQDIVKNIGNYVFGDPTSGCQQNVSREDLSAAMENSMAALDMDSDNE